MVEMATQTDPNSNEYLEMANHAQELVRTAQDNCNKYRKENLDLKKLIITVYGVIRIIDELNDNDEFPGELTMMLEVLRGYLSDNVEQIIK